MRAASSAATGGSSARRRRAPSCGTAEPPAAPRRSRLTVQALVATPGEERSTRVEEVAEPTTREGEVLVRVLEVGVCGTDREIDHGLFGVAPEHEETLVIGHELLGVVERDAPSFSRGQLVAATVRRSCGRCLACAGGSPDSCLTGDYRERGITRLHGFARELVAED